MVDKQVQVQSLLALLEAASFYRVVLPHIHECVVQTDSVGGRPVEGSLRSLMARVLGLWDTVVMCRECDSLICAHLWSHSVLPDRCQLRYRIGCHQAAVCLEHWPLAGLNRPGTSHSPAEGHVLPSQRPARGGQATIMFRGHQFWA